MRACAIAIRIRSCASMCPRTRSRPPTGRARRAWSSPGTGRCAAAVSPSRGKAKALGTLREPDAPFSLVFAAKSGATQAWFDGEVVPTSLEKVRGFIKVAGQDMAQLYPLLPAPVPWTPPYEIKGDVVRLPDRWKVTGLSGKVGRSDVRGSAEILTDTPRRKFVADIVSDRLDYRDLGGFVGLPPGASASARSPEQKAEAAKLARQDRVFSDDRFELDRLREYDAHFRFRGKALRVDDVPMDNVEMNIVVEQGVLRYDPVKVGIASGTVTLVGSLDANGKTPRLDART